MARWDWHAYWNKARAYHVTGTERGGDDTAFMSTLALEFLGRAVLTKINPALNAQPDDDGVSLLHACGFAVPGKPQSVQMKTVYARLEKIAPKSFTPTLSKKCRTLTSLRNEELHTAELPFAALKISDWLPVFYEAVDVFCDLLESSMDDFLGKKEAGVAREMIKAAQGSQLSATRQKIAAFAKVFNEKPENERTALRTAPIRRFGKRAPCPACETLGVVEGRGIRESRPSYGDDGLLTTEETYAADLFTCGACGLRLASLEEVIAAGIEPTFQTIATWDPRDDDTRTDDGPEYNNM
jgi:hypothetical protein